MTSETPFIAARLGDNCCRSIYYQCSLYSHNEVHVKLHHFTADSQLLAVFRRVIHEKIIILAFCRCSRNSSICGDNTTEKNSSVQVKQIRLFVGVHVERYMYTSE